VRLKEEDVRPESSAGLTEYDRQPFQTGGLCFRCSAKQKWVMMF
jgi:hypothetical protein